MSSISGRALSVAAAFLTALIFLTPTAPATEVTGAGSTFIYPIVAKWAAAYKAVSGDAVNYQSLGSGGGIKQIQMGTVDFGATDMPLTTADLDKYRLAQFPLIHGEVVVAIHLDALRAGEPLHLNGAVLAAIFLGDIKKWNDPAIAALNPGLTLPAMGITVVHRSDGSGTSYIWSGALCEASEEWKNSVGQGTAVNWPAGIGGKGNEGVAAYVKQIDGSIGYIEYAFALQNKMTMARLDRPILGTTYILMRRSPDRAGRAALGFFRWGYTQGADLARALKYVPLAEEEWRRALTSIEAAAEAEIGR